MDAALVRQRIRGTVVASAVPAVSGRLMQALCGNGLLPGVYVSIYRHRYPGIGAPEAPAARITYISFTYERVGNYWIPH